MDSYIPDGVWPTMVTPFTDSGEVDFSALGEMIEWYREKGVDGLFAVCKSSEMFKLSREERAELASFVREEADEEISVIASGHVAEDFADQVEELEGMAATGVDGLVLVSNRLAAQNESDQVWKRNAERIFRKIPEIPLGIYECPFPYRRLVSPQLLSWCASTERFFFLKDTSCDPDQLRAKARAVAGSDLKIFNANGATLLDSLEAGIAGYSGIMGNCHPELYSWLVDNFDGGKTSQIRKIQNFLGPASAVIRHLYPLSAKYYLQLEGLNVALNSRVRDSADFKASFKLEIEQLRALSNSYVSRFCN